VFNVATAALGRTPAREVDDDRAQHLRRVGHELPAAVEVDAARMVQSQIGFVHQRSRVEQG
jgi:hypothetical protein